MAWLNSAKGLWLLIGSAALLIVAACFGTVSLRGAPSAQLTAGTPTTAAAPSPTPPIATATTSPVVRASADGATPQALLNDALPDLEKAGVAVTMVGNPEGSDLWFGYGPAPQSLTARPVGREIWALASHWSASADNISLEELKQQLAGNRDWSLVVAGDPPPPIRAALGLGEPGSNWQRADDAAQAIERVVNGDRTWRVLLPVDRVDARLRSLAINDADPVRGRGDLDNYPLAAPLWLALRQPVNPKLAAANGWADQLQVRLDQRYGLPIKLTAVGDIIFGRKVDERLQNYGDYTRPFWKVADVLKAADITVGNVENTISDRVTPPHNWETFDFATSTKMVDGLRYAGIDAVSLANNHSAGFGPGPFADTLDALAAGGVKYFGGGHNSQEAHKPAVVEARGVRFAFLGYSDIYPGPYEAGANSAGVAAADPGQCAADVQAAKQVADVVIPFFHWGIEYTNFQNSRQRLLAQACIDGGADLVLGSHPHWVQGMEMYKGKLIIYGLGNFVFDQDWSTNTQLGLIAQLTFRGNQLTSLRLLPVKIEDLHQPRLTNPSETDYVMRLVREASDTAFQ